MKKLLALILVLAMLFAFASCTLFGGGDEDGKKDDDKDNVGDGGDDSGINSPFPDGGIDLPLVDIEPDGVE